MLGSTDFATLHRILQAVMGWENCHLHSFEHRGREFVWPIDREPFDVLDCPYEAEVALNQVLRRKGQRLRYIYDYGDGWLHDVLVESTGRSEDKAPYLVCLAGEGACPPEDSGGLGGYAGKLRAAADPSSEFHQEAMDWLPADFDPTHFDLTEANRRLWRVRMRG